MGRSPCCSKEGLNRGAWTAMEDQILSSYIKAHGEGKWRNLPKRAGLMRCGKSCRLRWLNYLRPDIKRGNISRDEEELIIRLHNLLGNRWSLIAGRLPGRTDNEIKNYWNTTLGKKAKSSSARSPTSPPSPTGKTTTSPASPGQTQRPSSAPAAKATRPQVVRARATWYSMYDLIASNPNRSSSDNQNYRLDLSSQIGPVGQYAWDSEISRIHLGTDQDVQENCCPDFDFFNFGCVDDRFQPSNDGEGENGIYYGNYYGTMEEAVLDNWWSQGGGGGAGAGAGAGAGDGGGVGGGVDEIKGTLDIESLTFTFDSEQWTCP